MLDVIKKNEKNTENASHAIEVAFHRYSYSDYSQANTPDLDTRIVLLPNRLVSLPALARLVILLALRLGNLDQSLILHKLQ